MPNLWTSFGLAFDTMVEIRISASNVMGQGAWSNTNVIGERVRQKPGKMSPVVKSAAGSTATSL